MHLGGLCVHVWRIYSEGGEKGVCDEESRTQNITMSTHI